MAFVNLGEYGEGHGTTPSPRPRGPVTRAQLRDILRRRDDNLRAHARKLARMHVHPPSKSLGKIVPPRPSPHRPQHAQRPTRIFDLPVEGWGDDEDELGFLGAILSAAAPIVGPILGSVLGTGGKSSPKAAPAAPVAAASAQAAPMMMQPSGLSLAAISGAIGDQIRAVPPPVRQQVTDAIRESMDRMKAGQASAHDMMSDIKKLLGPTLNAQLSKVNSAAVQRQATFEHNALQARDKRWAANAEAQKRIFDRLNEMEHKLGTALVTGGQRRVAVAKAFGVPPRLR